MSNFSVSSNGLVACGSNFIDLFGNRLPASVGLIGGGKKTIEHSIQPSSVAFSSFASIKSSKTSQLRRGKRNNMNAAGAHVLLAYDGDDDHNNNSFFSAVILRCDTWAVQWAVRRGGCLDGFSIKQMILLTAHTACGIATSTASGEERLFVASRKDVPMVGKRANRAWHSFLAPARFLTSDIASSQLVSITAASADSIYVLAGNGNVYRETIDFAALKDATKGPLSTTQHVATCRKKNIHPSSAMVFSDADNGQRYIVIYSKDAKTVDVLKVGGASRAGEVAKVSESTRFTVENKVSRIAAAGPHGFVISSAEKVPVMQWIRFPSENDASEASHITLGAPVSLSAAPLGFHYHRMNKTVSVVYPATEARAFETLTDEEKLNTLVYCSLPVDEGEPLSTEMLRKTPWTPVTNPFKQYGPHVRQYSQADSGEQLYQDIQGTRGSKSVRTAGGWTPLRLHYALATPAVDAKDVVEVAVFAVKTAPFLHNRLTKQWHNATAGLKSLLSNPAEGSAVCMKPWNPSHTRRALRLLSQTQLEEAFSFIAAALRRSAVTRGSAERVHYTDAAVAGVDMALQIITLARQLGVNLKASDIEVVAVLLRASRAAGHEIVHHTARMELLIESCLQQRVMNSFLGRIVPQVQETDAQNEEQRDAASIQQEFYSVPDDLQTERVLQTRYTANAWTQSFHDDVKPYRAIISQAQQYLDGIRTNAHEPAMNLCDWEQLGKKPHENAMFNEFESALVKYA